MDSKIDYTKYTTEAIREERDALNESDQPELYNELNELLILRIKEQNRIKDKQEKIKHREPAGCLGYVIGGMSFIPMIGVLFGIIAIIWGFNTRNSKLKYVGSAGILFSVVLYSSLGYFGFVQEDGVYDELRATMTKSQLTSAIQAIEFYKVQNGRYPDSLEILQDSLPENSMVFLHDAAQVNMTEMKLYYYQVIDENTYHIRSYGRDGVINTSDDILPTAIENVGLISDYQVVSGL